MPCTGTWAQWRKNCPSITSSLVSCFHWEAMRGKAKAAIHTGARVNLPYRGRQGTLLYCWGKITAAATNNQSGCSQLTPSQPSHAAPVYRDCKTRSVVILRLLLPRMDTPGRSHDLNEVLRLTCSGQTSSYHSLTCHMRLLSRPRCPQPVWLGAAMSTTIHGGAIQLSRDSCQILVISPHCKQRFQSSSTAAALLWTQFTSGSKLRYQIL